MNILDEMDEKTQNTSDKNSMTEDAILFLCKKHKLYVTPELNDVLYLHYQGFPRIENLDKYTGLKCLWLDNNFVSHISGLNNQKDLKCLYLQNNFIRKIENLESCSKLDTLNLSHNSVKAVENCDSSILPVLNTLNLSYNSLSSVSSLEGLIRCHTLSILDLSYNRIDDLLIVKTLSQMPELRVLTLSGNPVVNEIPSYRKTLIIECKKLTYLDSRPVLDRDRALAEAWKRGGFGEERKEHVKWIEAKQRKITNYVKAALKFKESEESLEKSDSGCDMNASDCIDYIFAEESVQTTHNDCNRLNEELSERNVVFADITVEKDTNSPRSGRAGDCTKVIIEGLPRSEDNSVEESPSTIKSSATHIAIAKTTGSEPNDRNSSIIFHCQNLESLEYRNVELDDSIVKTMCDYDNDDSEAESMITLSERET